MQFIITAYDGKDEEALSRRMAIRPSHLENIEKVSKSGCKVICAGGIMNDSGKPVGSFLIMEFPSRQSFDEYLNNEPYVTGNVWKDIQVQVCSAVIVNNEFTGK